MKSTSTYFTMRSSRDIVGSSSEPTWCLRVRTGSILIGLWHLIGQLFAMYLIVSKIKRRNDVVKDIAKTKNVIELHSDVSAYCAYLTIVLCSFVITAMMIKGVIRYRSSWILPFACFLVFHFLTVCLTSVVITLYYLDVHYENIPFLPSNENVLYYKARLPLNKWDMENPWVVFIGFALYSVVVIIKFYCVVCLWACYKYIVETVKKQESNSFSPKRRLDKK